MDRDNNASYLFSTLTTSIAVAGISMLIYQRANSKKSGEEQAKELHIDYGRPSSFPLPIRIIASLPDFIRIPLLIAASKPKPPRDSVDILGTTEVDPYKTWEFIPGKMWCVDYSAFFDPGMKKFLEAIFGEATDEKKKSIVQRAPDHLKETIQQDFEKSEKYDQLSEEEKVREGADMIQTTIISKINIGSEDEGLLIFNPCRMHPHFIDWINKLGKVKFIVSGSSAHTNHLPGAATLFPDAKIICASAADAKCRSAGMRPADYLYDIRRDDESANKYPGRGTLEDASEALCGEATLFHVSGDTATQALLLLVHGCLLEVDLIYQSGEARQREAEQGTTAMHSKGRIFFHSLISKDVPPLGYLLPMYRAMFLDPSTLFASKMMIDSPSNDGSTCTKMAQSLRSILKSISEGGSCDKVFSVHAKDMTFIEFKQIVNDTWGWLDGKSLIED